MKFLPLSGLGLLLAGPAFAHADPALSGFAAGLAHPVGGADHLLAMISVGLCAAILGGPARWALPFAFLCGMMAGFLAALGGFALPLVEPMLAASVVALGLMVAGVARLGPVAAGALVAGFGLFHGYAHASELGGFGAFGVAAGLVIASLLLQAAGAALAAGIRLRAAHAAPIFVAVGAVTAASGMAMAFG